MKKISSIVWGIVLIAAAIYGIYRFFAPDYLDDFEDELEDDFDEDFFEDEDVVVEDVFEEQDGTQSGVGRKLGTNFFG